MQKTSAASDVIRSTTYELQTGQFTGTTYNLTLNNDLSPDYYVMISGPSSATASRSVNEDQVRVSGDAHSNFVTVTAANQIQLTRATASNSWIGSLTVVECLIDCGNSGFTLSEVRIVGLSAGTANTLQTSTVTLSSDHSSRTVPFTGRFGGGMTSTSTDANVYAVTLGVKVEKISTNQLRFSRYGAESRVPAAATFTTYVVEWGSSWAVQNANVTGTNSGNGINAIGEYNTASISSVTRANTWVWGSGYTYNDGLGDGALGQVITLGDGVNQNATETTVAVGSELAQTAPGRNFQVYVLSNASLTVDHRFKPTADAGAGTGFQELNLTISGTSGSETYDNASSTVQYTQGKRFPILYTSSTGNGQAYSRAGAWGVRINSATNLNYWRAYAGQNVGAWSQIVDFSGFSFSNVNTRQQLYRWRDDSVDVNTDGGWLAAEDAGLPDQNKNTSLRLRLRVANHGSTPEDSAREYELQFGERFASQTCSDISVWTGVSDSATDAFELYQSIHINPDQELLTSSLLSNPDGFSYVSGLAMESNDTSSSLGPLSNSAYTELEYALRPTKNAVTGSVYCFRLFDASSTTELEQYVSYPEIRLSSNVISSTGLGEAGTFTSANDGGWTPVSFAGNYTNPVVVGTTNTHNGESALVFESRNVTSTGADMRVCESEGATANGCDTHGPETVGYMVIDAAVAATVDGIEAGTFTASGEADSNSVTTSYSESFVSTPLVFSNVNTVNSTEFPIEVVISATSVGGFTAGICDHLQSSNDSCDPAHGNETVGWVAIEPGNEPFQEQFYNGIVSVSSSTWTPVTFSSPFPASPVLIVASQTDTGGQDVEIDEARNVTVNGADVRYCEIDTLDNCDSHNADDVAWFAIEPGEFSQDIEIDQDNYRFYENLNSLTPSIALADEDTPVSNVDDGGILRLRFGAQAGQYPVGVDAISVKLQYAQSAECSLASGWSDVGAISSGEIWRGFNNATPADGATLPSSLLNGGANTPMSYEESNNSATNNAIINPGDRGEWDWVIENNGADDFTNYCFRMVTDDDSELYYTAYAELTTSNGVPNLAPNAPTNLEQEKTSTVDIATGDPTNETTVVFRAEATDQNTNDILELCVEVAEVGEAFTNVDTACGSPDSYSATVYPCAPTGNAFYEKYDGTAGTAIGDLYADPNYPNSPTSTQTISSGLLESPINIDDNFGARLSALVCAPQDGDYTFWLTGDDGSELYVSSDTSPANTSLAAEVVGWTNVGEWTKYPSQQSSPITLSAGQYYYVEGNYKEGAGGDHVQIGWTLPDATVERPISSTNYSLPSETGAVSTVPGVTPSLSVSVSGLENSKDYHWQVRTRDASGDYSSWVSYGANAESETDFFVDTVAPSAVVYDGSSAGVDIEFNSGELDEISANWSVVNGVSPDEITGLVLWLDGSDVEADGTDPLDGSSLTSWNDKSGGGNDISGTGAATFDAGRQAVAFSDDALPFDDTFDRSGGNANAHSVYSAVAGNANTGTNHVWYETTTPRIAPAENGILGAGTTLSNNNNWSNHITDTKLLTVEYDSSGTSTSWLDRREEHQFSETPVFADSQRIVIGDDTTGGNRLETGEFVHEIIVFNEDISDNDREALWEHMECKWSLKDCSVTYDYAIGTSPGGVDVQSWTSVGSSTSVTATSLSLETSNIYYVSLRVSDEAGNQTIVTSDGQQVAPSFSFGAGLSTIEFDNLNAANGFSDTETSLLTTSTNARNGYTVRSYLEGLLENENADTIASFDGGTYASPDEWQLSDRGYGYTSSDTLVGGSNKFNPVLCAGGGGGPCYAPFSTSAPGDIVADNPGVVSGSPIINEQFTITHRVTTDEDQAPGTYRSNIVFSATANY